MLRILSIVLALAGIAAIGVLVNAWRKPDTFAVERSMVINTPAERIYALIADVKAMNRWNPFAQSDPTIRINYRGPESATGAGYSWEGSNRAGKGHLTATGATPARSVEMSLVMEKPFAASNEVRFSLQPSGSGTSVTWTMSGPWPYLHRIMGTIFDMDKMVGGEFEKGLRDLKAIAEAR